MTNVNERSEKVALLDMLVLIEQLVTFHVDLKNEPSIEKTN